MQTALQTKAAEVAAKDAEVQTVTSKVRVYAEQKAEAEKRAGSLDAWAGSLVRWLLWAGALYVIVHYVLPCVAQEFPAVRWLSAINKAAKSVSSAHL